MERSRILDIFVVINLLLITAAWSAPAAKGTDAVAQQLAQLSNNEKVNALAKELEHLQQEMKNVKTGDSTSGEVAPIKQHILPANTYRAPEKQPEGVFLDGPVEVKSRAKPLERVLHYYTNEKRSRRHSFILRSIKLAALCD